MKPRTRNIYKEVILATVIGAFVGFLISLWRDKPIAIFLCAAVCGGAVFLKAFLGRRKEF